MPTIHNPIIRGFNPDPSIVRVGEDYYVATSTFEWFPGVQLHHSRDLANWRLIGHALTRTSQLDLRGVTDSAGVWAPSLSYCDGQFWLIYTIVRTAGAGRPFKDVEIYLITAPDILGPWSDPIALNAIGFDPSLFHNDDGRKYLVNIEWDFRKGRHRFNGIVLQEYDPRAGKLIGPMRKILGKPGVLDEGPNLYKHNGWYYLMLAEGGTGWEHGIAMARSRVLWGPYELDPQRALLTARDLGDDAPLQKAGHGEIVETAAGEWYLAHLASRALGSGALRRCPLGRETCLQRVFWTDDGWLRLAHGGWHPQVDVAGPAGVSASPWPSPAPRDEFDAPTLNPHWTTLRIPPNLPWLSLTERPGWLRLRGRQSVFSHFDQSLVAKRLQTFRAVAETCLEFEPTHFTQMAGLICWYDMRTHYYLRVAHDETAGKVLGIALADDGEYDELIDAQLSIADWPRAYLRAEIDRERLQFFASPDGRDWQKVGSTLDASKLSDDYGKVLHFTGAFVGLCAQDMGGTWATADFDYFELKPL